MTSYRTAPALALLALALGTTAPAAAQTFRTDDPVLRQMWVEGMERSRAERYAQVLMDSIGPRLTGTPEKQAGHDWLVGMPSMNRISSHVEGMSWIISRPGHWSSVCPCSA
jgi:carboxypeptidase Q